MRQQSDLTRMVAEFNEQGKRMPEITQAARDDIRATVAKMQTIRDTSPESFGGHKGIALANLEGYLGRYPLALLDALEAAEATVSELQKALAMSASIIRSGESMSQEADDRIHEALASARNLAR